jgi:hypothetical protein
LALQVADGIHDPVEGTLEEALRLPKLGEGLGAGQFCLPITGVDEPSVRRLDHSLSLQQ